MDYDKNPLDLNNLLLFMHGKQLKKKKKTRRHFTIEKKHCEFKTI